MEDSKLDDFLARLTLPSPQKAGLTGKVRLLLLLVWASCFAGTMAWEWKAWPNGSAAFGPFVLIYYQAFDGCSLAVTLILLAMIFAFPLKPHFVTFFLSVLGILGWLFMGLIGRGIAC